MPRVPTPRISLSGQRETVLGPTHLRGDERG
jgi:hypothetical protein